MFSTWSWDRGSFRMDWNGMFDDVDDLTSKVWKRRFTMNRWRRRVVPDVVGMWKLEKNKYLFQRQCNHRRKAGECEGAAAPLLGPKRSEVLAIRA